MLTLENCLATIAATLDKHRIPYYRNYFIIEPDVAAVQADLFLPTQNLGINISYAVDVSYDIRQDWPKTRNQEFALIARRGGSALVHLLVEEFNKTNVWPYVRSRIIAATRPKLKLGARSCDLVALDAKSRATFLDTYHAHGSVARAATTLALAHDGDILACMALGRARYNSDGLEMLRYCVRPDVAISGGFDRLLKASMTEVGEAAHLTTFADLNWQMRPTTVYDSRLDFTGVTVPDYRWVCPATGDIRSRYSCMKHKLIQEGADPTLTENKIMWSRGYIRVFGAGSLRYELNRTR